MRDFRASFPTPENQSLGEWTKVWERDCAGIGEDAMLVGHSLGVPFLLRVLEKNRAKSAFFVSGFSSDPHNAYSGGMASFLLGGFDWDAIRKNCPKFLVFHSDNDPYVGIEKARELAEKLGTEPIIVKGAGHFNKAAGYEKFGLLLEKMSIMMQGK